jgi:hypothetical protein
MALAPGWVIRRLATEAVLPPERLLRGLLLERGSSSGLVLLLAPVSSGFRLRLRGA